MADLLLTNTLGETAMHRLMSPLFAAALTIAALPNTTSHAQSVRPTMQSSSIQAVSPALAGYQSEFIENGLWKRPGLSMRDRSIVTVAILIARNQPHELKRFLERALDNGVSPKEISEIITHLAFYSGWGNATAAVAVAEPIFSERGYRREQLPEEKPALLSIDKAAEAKRAAGVEENAGPVSDGLVTYTRDLLFNDLWLRPDLAPRDRSLVTVSALIAGGQFAQITFHLNKAMDNGLTKEQAGEVITQGALYAGWPNAFSAVQVFKEVLTKR